ncbi:MAG: NAD(P)H-hydrate dehydratase [Planctomycetota bacterium]|nr:NAD(P)H-hydrate dehydratase [Planctomycetota bacterium]
MTPKLPTRPSISHKGDYGRGLLVGGSRGMTGAICLSGLACMRSGAGLLKVATPAGSQPIVAGFDPNYMTLSLPEDEKGQIAIQARELLTEEVQSCTAMGIGPGLGQSGDLVDFVSWAYSRISAPMVVDADSLNCLAANPTILGKPGGPRILTPHLGELRRLLDDQVSSPKELQYRTESLARESGIIIVIKGHRSIITDGEQRKQNMTGNSGMATAGSGDVLTGILTGLLCQGMSAFDACRLGCLIHGLAGDAAARRIGKISLVASDIVRFIPKAIRAIRRKERRRVRKKIQHDSSPNQQVE